jgi:hypothetical protein
MTTYPLRFHSWSWDWGFDILTFVDWRQKLRLSFVDWRQKLWLSFLLFILELSKLASGLVQGLMKPWSLDIILRQGLTGIHHFPWSRCTMLLCMRPWVGLRKLLESKLSQGLKAVNKRHGSHVSPKVQLYQRETAWYRQGFVPRIFQPPSESFPKNASSEPCHITHRESPGTAMRIAVRS